MTDVSDNALPSLPAPVAELVAARRMGVLTTLRRNGRPQQSVVSFAADERGGTVRIRISVTATRAKTRNAARNPAVSLLVATPDLTRWAVLDGTAELTPVTTAPGDQAGQALVALYRDIAGEHSDWDEYAAAMIEQQRQVLTITVEHTYGGAAG